MALSDKNSPDSGDGDETQGPVIRDNRRIDPETGEVREPKVEETKATNETPITQDGERTESEGR